MYIGYVGGCLLFFCYGLFWFGYCVGRVVMYEFSYIYCLLDVIVWLL